jgi:hypothetical protein
MLRRFSPLAWLSVYCLMIYVIIVLFVWPDFEKLRSIMATLGLGFALAVISWLLGFLLFPKCVVTFKNVADGDELTILCDGRAIKAHAKGPIWQTHFQLGRRGKYIVYVTAHGFKESQKEINTYGNRVEHVEFTLEKNRGAS